MLNFYRFRQDYLKFEGNDRLDLINRLSTNQVTTLQKHNGIKTVLTSDKGRFVDLITLYNFGDFVFTACSFNNATNVISHLDKYTIMDDFRVQNMTGTHETFLCFGDRAEEFAEELSDADIRSFANNDFVIFKIGGTDSVISRNDDGFGGFSFIYPAEAHALCSEFITSNAKKFNAVELDHAQFEEKRINLGIPVFGNEITGLTNPLECGLNEYVSFTKGCYIGQEVIARLDTYDKISKHLIRLEAEDNLQREGSKIVLEGKECGFVSSAAKNKGLGFVKTIFLDYHKDYQVRNNDSLINCKIKPIKK